MSDLFDTASVRDEPEHWDELAKRLAVNAALESGRGGFTWLVRSRAGWVASGFLLTLALISMLARGDNSFLKSRTIEWANVLAPADDVGKAIVLPSGPPAIGDLVLDVRGGA